MLQLHEEMSADVEMAMTGLAMENVLIINVMTPALMAHQDVEATSGMLSTPPVSEL